MEIESFADDRRESLTITEYIHARIDEICYTFFQCGSSDSKEKQQGDTQCDKPHV